MCDHVSPVVGSSSAALVLGLPRLKSHGCSRPDPSADPRRSAAGSTGQPLRRAACRRHSPGSSRYPRPLRADARRLDAGTRRRRARTPARSSFAPVRPRAGSTKVYEPEDPGAATGGQARAHRLRFRYRVRQDISISTGQCPVKKYNLRLRDLIIRGQAYPSVIVSHELGLDEAFDAYAMFEHAATATQNSPPPAQTP